jgi:HSP20 family protein
MSTSLAPFQTRWTNLFGDFEHAFNRACAGPSNGNETAAMTVWLPHVNLSETENAYLVAVDLPGMTRDEINVEVVQGDLWITGERRQESEESGKTFHRVECAYGTFRRMIRLGDAVDSERVDAEYKEGVLRITVPKAEAAKPHRIEIRCC